MARFELVIAGDIPAGCDLGLLDQVVVTLNSESPDWLHDGIINLKLVDDAEMQELNREYSGNDYATDVLSFSYIEDGMERPIENEIGDMVIDYQIAGRQAAQAKTTIADELATLGLHGIMHINGFDHQDSESKGTMDTIQREILTKAGVAYRDFGWLS